MSWKAYISIHQSSQFKARHQKVNKCIDEDSLIATLRAKWTALHNQTVQTGTRSDRRENERNVSICHEDKAQKTSRLFDKS
jgi:hypothetical protein